MRSPAVDQTIAAKAGCTSDGTRHSRLRITTDFALLRLCEASHNRKAWLFTASERGGKAAAIAFSLIETCKLNGVEPFAYLKDVLGRLSSHRVDRLAELLPFNWTPAAA